MTAHQDSESLAARRDTRLATLAPDLFLPEPAPREVTHTVISVDDHVVEPPHTFEGRLPAALQDRAPRIVETPAGHQVWEFEGQQYTQVGMNAVAGRRLETVELEPFRFDQMRPGCYDVDARMRDMDVNGVWASVNFPSQITGFCGTVFFSVTDRELGVACIRAWNDWLFEEWYQRYPDRIVPLGITYLADPALAVDEIRRNAARGFTSVTFPERPHAIGLPSLWERDHWDPIIAACAETDTVISLHVGSSGIHVSPQGAPKNELSATLFGQLALTACAEWLWSAYPVKHANLKIALSEGGIGWVAMLLDRVDYIVDHSRYGLGWAERPSDVLRRNFWFCTLEDHSTIDTRYAIGVENIMIEVDYPHGDTTWPDTQLVIDKAWGHLPVDERRAMCSENAAALYRHPLPEVVVPRALRRSITVRRPRPRRLGTRGWTRKGRMGTYNHSGQVVTHLERSKRFYENVFGFKFWYEIEPPDEMTAKLNCLEPPLRITASYLVLDGFVLELMHYSAPGATAPYRPRTMNEPGLTHLSVSVEDVRATAEKVVEYGGEVIEESDVGVAVFVRDPDGQLLELLPSTYRAGLPPKP
jgi:predicted TIM-barrel fold metal-dependent hydrolase/catechol 2,3-dioxygenase-like lactoylglutathione lyase family enzyme